MTDGSHTNRVVDGVVIPNESPIMTGDEAQTVIHEIDRLMADDGYTQVRKDRWRLDAPGMPWVERGYVYGEVTVRFSHRPRNYRIMHADPISLITFRELVRDNASLAEEAQS